MRTRFAPSPTGQLHIGGLRTALYAYLVAKQTKGQFLLRIEDTDQERTVEGAMENILRTLHWAGLDPDEGVMMRDGYVTQEGAKGPYIQSERTEIYREHVQKLLEKGHAYRCFCSADRLDQMRKDQQAHKQAPMYDRLCCALSNDDVQKKIDAGEKFVVRLKVPRERVISFTDDIRGEVKFMGHTIDDQVLMKSDNFPTYHLANVVDDHLMDINIVMRGEEWLSSTPKHLLLFEAFGWQPPRYAHLPLLLNKDKSKLSKRQNDVAAEDYIDQGYLRETLINFLAMLGWSPGTTDELFTMEELLEQFSIERVQKAGAVFDVEKLNWLQGQWMRKQTPEEFAENVLPYVAKKYPEAKSDEHFQVRAAMIQDRLTFYKEGPEMLSYYYEEPTVGMDLLANAKQKVSEDMVADLLRTLIDTLDPILEHEWTEDTLQEKLFAARDAKELKTGQLLWPMRAALTGLPFSPGAFEVAAQLGRDITLQRLEVALAGVQS